MARGQILGILDQDDHEDYTAEDVSHNMDDDDRNDDPTLGPHAGGGGDGLGELHQQGDGRRHAVKEGEAVHWWGAVVKVYF